VFCDYFRQEVGILDGINVSSLTAAANYLFNSRVRGRHFLVNVLSQRLITATGCSGAICLGVMIKLVRCLVCLIGTEPGPFERVLVKPLRRHGIQYLAGFGVLPDQLSELLT